ncbi:putative ferric-chelate reductase 1 [Pecten maximus]|uniref:putative ferric-chelate reductase 1 n=1 Tax=Pecten maximus TaxID=6579 RepID=UPI001458364D|nr:putative ferric-chelate reductase 1 [Pecten maximus]
MWTAVRIVILTIAQSQVTDGVILPDSGCGATKGCYPESCPVNGCSDFFVSWEDAGDYLRFVMTFEISAGDNTWVALAFSKDVSMPDSSVVMCRLEGGATSIEMGHTNAMGFSYASLSSNYGLQNTAVSRNGTLVVCSFDRIKNATQTEAQIFDLDQPLHLMHGQGDIASGNPQYHSSRFVTSNTFDLLNVTQPSEGTTNSPTTVQPGGSVTLDPACGVTKGCFSDCQGPSCSVLVTWMNVDDQNIDFEISADVPAGSDSWVAIGFSDDKSMGSDSVVACVTSGVVSVQTGYNTGTSYGSLTPDNLGLTSASGSVVNSVLNCKFTRKTNITGEPSFFDIRENWHLFFARGPVVPGNLRKHTQTPIVSEGTVDFLSTDLQNAAKLSYILVKVHGSLMVVAWVLFSSIGIFVARYLKPMWPNSTILGQKVWFQIHRTCMVTVFVLTAASFVIIFIEVGGFSDDVGISDDSHKFATYHPFFGIVVMALTVINPFITLFRCAPGHKRRPIFNFYHWFFGTSAHVIAAVTIVFAMYLDKSNVPPSAKYIAISYPCVFVFLDLVLEIYLLIKKKKSGQTFDLELKRQGDDTLPDTSPSTDNQERGPFAKVMLGIQIVSMAAFAVILIVLLAREEDD